MMKAVGGWNVKVVQRVRKTCQPDLIQVHHQNGQIHALQLIHRISLDAGPMKALLWEATWQSGGLDE